MRYEQNKTSQTFFVCLFAFYTHQVMFRISCYLDVKIFHCYMLVFSDSEQGRGIKAHANLASMSSVLQYIML